MRAMSGRQTSTSYSLLSGSTRASGPINSSSTPCSLSSLVRIIPYLALIAHITKKARSLSSPAFAAASSCVSRVTFFWSIDIFCLLPTRYARSWYRLSFSSSCSVALTSSSLAWMRMRSRPSAVDPRSWASLSTARRYARDDATTSASPSCSSRSLYAALTARSTLSSSVTALSTAVKFAAATACARSYAAIRSVQSESRVASSAVNLSKYSSSFRMWLACSVALRRSCRPCTCSSWRPTDCPAPPLTTEAWSRAISALIKVSRFIAFSMCALVSVAFDSIAAWSVWSDWRSCFRVIRSSSSAAFLDAAACRAGARLAAMPVASCLASWVAMLSTASRCSVISPMRASDSAWSASLSSIAPAKLPSRSAWSMRSGLVVLMSSIRDSKSSRRNSTGSCVDSPDTASVVADMTASATCLTRSDPLEPSMSRRHSLATS
mmetsp:Transcript_18248/g.47662  ORF Transcript_18248/g.47662 Transcript_18248/m.47662 type:complete len:436 (+) Transcript_18248:120-1427(+)